MSDELRIKIILDDGSVKDGFVSAERQAEKSAKKIGKSFDEKGAGLQSLADGAEAAAGGINSLSAAAIRAAGPYGTIAAAIAATTASLFKMSLAGEQVNAVNLQFENIATSAGLAADNFKESIIASTQGLIDDEDALQIATKGIVALGEQASKIPAIMDAARGASRALGKDFKTTFEDLSTFVENGNARVLRQYGIVLDLEKAYAAAAKSIGVATGALTEQQKQQIRANLILDEVPSKFNAAAASVTPLKDAFDKLKVSAGNALDTMFLKTNKNTGPFLASFVNEINQMISKGPSASQALLGLISPTSLLANTLKDAGSSAKMLATESLENLKTKSVDTSNQIDILNSKITGLLKEREQTKGISGLAGIDTSIMSYKKEIESLGASLAEIDKEIMSKVAARGAAAGVDTPVADPIKANPEQLALAKQEQLKRLNDLQAYVSAQDKLVLDAEIKRIDSINNLDQRLTAQKSAFAQQSILLEQQKNTAIAQVEQQFSDTNKFTQEQRDMAVLATKQNYYMQEQALAQANADKIKSIEDNKNMSVSGGFIAAADGMKMAAQDFANNSVAKFQELGKQSFATLGQGVGNAFNKFGSALKSGADAGKAFESAIGDTIAGVASQFGDLFIQTGIGKLALSYGTDATGYALIAAGAALKLLVGMSGAGGSTASSASSDGGGGIAATPTTATELTPTQDLQRAEATTGVSIVIQGDVLDSDESGSRIVNLINQAFDKKGVVINQGVMA